MSKQNYSSPFKESGIKLMRKADVKNLYKEEYPKQGDIVNLRKRDKNKVKYRPYSAPPWKF